MLIILWTVNLDNWSDRSSHELFKQAKSKHVIAKCLSLQESMFAGLRAVLWRPHASLCTILLVPMLLYFLTFFKMLERCGSLLFGNLWLNHARVRLILRICRYSTIIMLSPPAKTGEPCCCLAAGSNTLQCQAQI